MSSRTYPQPIGYDALEGRRLLAGNVTVFESDHLYIRGDASDNQVEVVAVGDQLVFNGLEGTTINGQDSYVVRGSKVTDSGVAFEGGLDANFGQGSDDFLVQDAIFESASIIYGGTGHDKIDVVDSQFMDELFIQTYQGDDSISTTRSHFEESFFIFGLDGEDSVFMTDSIFAGDSYVITGNHSDTIHSDGSHYMGDINLVLPLDGDDTVRLTNPVVGENQLGVFLGEGDDTFHGDLSEAEIDGTILIAGQGGTDQAMEIIMSDEAILSVTMDVENTSVDDNGVSSVDGVWWAYDRGDSVEGDRFRYRASAVEFGETTQINSIDWLGSYYGSEAAESDNFVVEIFENENIESTNNDYWYRQPAGEAVARFNIGNNANRVDTGEVFNDARNFPESLQSEFDRPGVTRKIFSYSADINFEFLAGETYWVSIYAVVDAVSNAPTFANDLGADDFAVLLDFPGNGGPVRYIPPTGTEAEPFQNTNAILVDESVGLGLDPSRWLFSSIDSQMLFTLNP